MEYRELADSVRKAEIEITQILADLEAETRLQVDSIDVSVVNTADGRTVVSNVSIDALKRVGSSRGATKGVFLRITDVRF